VHDRKWTRMQIASTESRVRLPPLPPAPPWLETLHACRYAAQPCW
jgi:hypothetical protein